MKISKKRFVLIFLISAFVFQFISNSILGPEVGLFPGDGIWYPGSDSTVVWKNVVASILFPIKYVLIEPLSFLGQDPDPVPPILVLAFGIYWTILALVLYSIFDRVRSHSNA